MSTLDFSDQDRGVQLRAKLGDLPVTVTHFQGTEELSRLFTFQLEFLSTQHDLNAQALIKKPATVGIQSATVAGQPPSRRYFNGVINRLTYRGETSSPGQPGARLSRYRAEIVPWLWFLTRTNDCRIFQARTVVEIVESVLNQNQGDFTTDDIRDTYPRREYCVQYRESDFAFISRLLEEEGIFYYFRHTADSHEMVLADRVTAYFACEDDRVPFREMGSAAVGNHISAWEHDYGFHTGKYEHTDFNYLAPGLALSTNEKSVINVPGVDQHAVYDYPGKYDSVDEGRRLARIRMQEQEAAQNVVRGEGVCAAFSPGATFKLTEHPNKAEVGTTHVITLVHHTASFPLDSTGQAGDAAYANRFQCIPSATLFRPERRTHRPIISGPQTAIVTGPDDELVYPDEYGRVKVQFHWDRLGQRNEDSSCWIRVSQAWAGSGYGNVMLPHVGHEVMISFLEGDPDRPVITGRLYHSDNMPPETLPENKHRAIVAQDRVGNVIALDADAKRVDIQNAEDKFELTVGESVSATAGMDVEITLGCSVGINLGASASASLAASFDVGMGIASSVFLGGAYDSSFGASFSHAKGNFVNAGDSVGQIAFKQEAEFVSHESVTLAGGSGDQNSVLQASSDYLILSYGQTSPTFAGSPKLALGLGVFGAAVLGTVGIAAAGAAAFLGAKASEKGEFDDYAKGAVGSGTGSLALSAVAGVLLAMYAKNWSQVKQPLHGGPLPAAGQLTLFSEGAKLWGQRAVQLHGEQSTSVVTNSFRVQSPEAQMSGNLDVKGVFKSANILDIGNPAATAAAAAQAAAEAARNKAIVAARAAIHAAKQARIAAAAK